MFGIRTCTMHYQKDKKIIFLKLHQFYAESCKIASLMQYQEPQVLIFGRSRLLSNGVTSWNCINSAATS